MEEDLKWVYNQTEMSQTELPIEAPADANSRRIGVWCPPVTADEAGGSGV